MLRAGAEFVQCCEMRCCGIALVLGEAVAGILCFHFLAVGVARGLGENRGGGDEKRFRVALHNVDGVRKGGDGESIDEDVEGRGLRVEG